MLKKHHQPPKMIQPARLMLHKFLCINKRQALSFLFLFLIPLTSQAANNMAVASWQENTYINSSGKISEILAQGRIKNLPVNRVMTAFAINFSPSRNVKITDVICDGKEVKFSFSNGSLKINFPLEKSNGDPFSIYFSYEEKYEKVDKFLREEVIDIPDFAAGADAKVIINFPGYLESATLNPRVSKGIGSYTYSNKVPLTGVREIIKLTPAQTIWDVNIKAKITSVKGLNKATVLLPVYFQNGGHKVSDSKVTSSTAPLKQTLEDGFHKFTFDTNNKIVVIENKARVTTGGKNRLPISRNPSDYLAVPTNEAAILAPVLERIKRDPKYQDLPLYARIGKYVNELITYDAAYTGKLPSISDILRNPTGVCSEYSALYNALARLAKIPAVNIEGAACGDHDQCLGHAWNAIYIDGKWIEVDPTWDLMSGVVSSSHIYFNDYGKGGVMVMYLGEKSSVSPLMDFEMKEAN